MKSGWRQSIIFRAAVAVVGSGILAGMLFIGATAIATNERAQQQSLTRLGELLDTVESTVKIACFVEDQTLATEIVRGLLKNTEVLGVVIRSNTKPLASSYARPATPDEQERILKGRLVRKIYSPFNSSEAVGEILLDPNPEEFDRLIGQEIRFVGLQLWLQLAAVVAVIVFVMLRLIVRPIKAMSDRLHEMDAASGDRVSVPKGYSGTEVERLGQDINALADRLVASLDEEHELRLAHEVDEKKYRAIFDNAETGIFLTDEDGRIESRNPALGRLLGLADEAAGHGGILLHTLPWREPEWVLHMIESCVEGREACPSDVELLSPDGSSRWLNIVLSPIGGGRAQGIVNDVTERKLTEESARLQAITDPLTGSANRPGLEQKLQATIRQNQTVLDTGFTPSRYT